MWWGFGMIWFVFRIIINGTMMELTTVVEHQTIKESITLKWGIGRQYKIEYIKSTYHFEEQWETQNLL